MSAQEQLVFELPHRAALEDVDFLVSGCNQEAVRLIDSWPDWPNRVHVITGPAGSGKSHLGNVWLLKTSGLRLAGSDLDDRNMDRMEHGGAVLLEDLDRGAIDETGLFHMLNLVKERDVSVLMTARKEPVLWRVHLPDLTSRLRSLPVTTIGAPDDHLLRAVLLKQFLDRQLNVEPNVIDFLAKRMERSMEAVRRLVVGFGPRGAGKGAQDYAPVCGRGALQVEARCRGQRLAAVLFDATGRGMAPGLRRFAPDIDKGGLSRHMIIMRGYIVPIGGRISSSAINCPVSPRAVGSPLSHCRRA